jgi:hypothetical protein
MSYTYEKKRKILRHQEERALKAIGKLHDIKLLWHFKFGRHIGKIHYSHVSLKRLRWHDTYHWKGYPNMNWKDYSDVSLKRLRWWVTDHWKGYPNMNWKDYSDISLKRLRWWVTNHWKGYPNMNWKDYSDMLLKGYDDGSQITEKDTLTWTEKTTLTCHWKGYDDGSQIIEKCYSDVNWKDYSNVSLK